MVIVLADTLITITSQQTIIYNPVLNENKSFVSGVVTDTSGIPVPGARVNYLYDMGTGFSAPSDSAGNYILAVPSNIAVKVYATKSGWSTSDTITVNIPENQTETHNFMILQIEFNYYGNCSNYRSITTGTNVKCINLCD